MQLPCFKHALRHVPATFQSESEVTKAPKRPGVVGAPSVTDVSAVAMAGAQAGLCTGDFKLQTDWKGGSHYTQLLCHTAKRRREEKREALRLVLQEAGDPQQGWQLASKTGQPPPGTGSNAEPVPRHVGPQALSQS